MSYRTNRRTKGIFPVSKEVRYSSPTMMIQEKRIRRDLTEFGPVGYTPKGVRVGTKVFIEPGGDMVTDSQTNDIFVPTQPILGVVTELDRSGEGDSYVTVRTEDGKEYQAYASSIRVIH